MPYQKSQKYYTRFIQTLIPFVGLMVFLVVACPYSIKAHANPVLGQAFTLTCKNHNKTCGISVVDGDSFVIDGVHYRMIGIDTPEISKARCGKEEQMGRRAKKAVYQRLNQAKYVTIHPLDYDKYNRILANFDLDNAPLGAWLIENKLALIWQPGYHAWQKRKAHWCAGKS